MCIAGPCGSAFNTGVTDVAGAGDGVAAGVSEEGFCDLHPLTAMHNSMKKIRFFRVMGSNE
jgi:hypothetical protein